MQLDLSSLRLALASLDRAIARSRQAPEDEELRDAVIQRFEYSYELCWRMLKRRLELDLPTPAEADRLSFPELIREAAERGLVEAPERWFEYRRQRNVTAHTYDRSKAESVHATALLFAIDARMLLGLLERRNDA